MAAPAAAPGVSGPLNVLDPTGELRHLPRRNFPAPPRASAPGRDGTGGELRAGGSGNGGAEGLGRGGSLVADWKWAVAGLEVGWGGQQGEGQPVAGTGRGGQRRAAAEAGGVLRPVRGVLAVPRESEVLPCSARLRPEN